MQDFLIISKEELRGIYENYLCEDNENAAFAIGSLISKLGSQNTHMFHEQATPPQAYIGYNSVLNGNFNFIQIENKPVKKTFLDWFLIGNHSNGAVKLVDPDPNLLGESMTYPVYLSKLLNINLSIDHSVVAGKI